MLMKPKADDKKEDVVPRNIDGQPMSYEEWSADVDRVFPAEFPWFITSVLVVISIMTLQYFFG
jgi:hypothetical protein